MKILLTCLLVMFALPSVTHAVTPKTYNNVDALARHRQDIVPLASCGDGNDFYDGGAGTDTLVLSGERTEFYIIKNRDHSYTFRDLTSCRNDTDTVINVERVQFAGKTVKMKSIKPDEKEVTSSTKSAKNATLQNLSVASVEVAFPEIGGGSNVTPDQHLTVQVKNNEYGSASVSYKKFKYAVYLYEVVNGKNKKKIKAATGEAYTPYANGYSEFQVYIEGGFPFNGDQFEREYIAEVRIDTGNKVKESNEKDNKTWSDSWLMTYYKG